MGGAEISAMLLAQGLSDLGVEVHVLTPDYNSSSSRYSEENGVFIHRFGSPRKFLFKGRRASQETYVRWRALYYLIISRYIRFSAGEFSKKMTKLHSKEKFDLIHSQNVESVFGLNLSDVNCPKIEHLRGLQYWCIDGSKRSGDENCVECSVQGIKNCLRTNRFFAKLINRELKWRGEHIRDFRYIAVSKYIAQEAEKQGLPSEKLFPLHNPVDES